LKNQEEQSRLKITRRKLIFVGVAGAVAAGGLWAAGRTQDGNSVRGGALIQKHSTALHSLTLALLGSALSADAPQRGAEIGRTSTAVGALIDNLPPHTRGEIAQLLDLLSIKPARALLGYSGNWEESDTANVAQFLYGLRDSSLAIKKQAYFALHDLVFGSFYADPSSWRGSGYVGPPKLS
jgi:hypothetical protein